MPTALREYEKTVCPLLRNRSLHQITRIPAIRPMETRPVGPIQLLSNASLIKYETPINTAAIPIRFNHSLPIFDSKSGVSAFFAAVARGWGGACTGGIGGAAMVGGCWAC